MTSLRLLSNRSTVRAVGLLPATTFLGFFLLIPLGLVVVYSFLEKGSYGGVTWSFSLNAYEKLFFYEQLDGSKALNTAFLGVLFRSIVLAVVTTLLCFLVAFPGAYFISCRKPFMRGILLLLVLFPFWSNLLVRTASWVILLRDEGLINKVMMAIGVVNSPLELLYTEGAILVGLVYVYLPFMVLPIFTSVERLDRRLIEASFDLYASRAETLRRIILPLSMPGIIAGSVLVFIPSLGAFITPELLGGGRKLMLGSLIELQFTTARDWPYGSALSIALLIMVVAVLALTARLKSPGNVR